jgi:hypothetical protein
MALNFLFQLVVGVALNILAYLLMPKPKVEKPPSTEDLQEPTSEAGRPIPVIFGTVTQKGANLIGAWDKQSIHRPTRRGKK